MLGLCVDHTSTRPISAASAGVPGTQPLPPGPIVLVLGSSGVIVPYHLAVVSTSLTAPPPVTPATALDEAIPAPRATSNVRGPPVGNTPAALAPPPTPPLGGFSVAPSAGAGGVAPFATFVGGFGSGPTVTGAPLFGTQMMPATMPVFGQLTTQPPALFTANSAHTPATTSFSFPGSALNASPLGSGAALFGGGLGSDAPALGSGSIFPAFGGGSTLPAFGGLSALPSFGTSSALPSFGAPAVPATSSTSGSVDAPPPPFSSSMEQLPSRKDSATSGRKKSSSSATPALSGLNAAAAETLVGAGFQESIAAAPAAAPQAPELFSPPSSRPPTARPKAATVSSQTGTATPTAPLFPAPATPSATGGLGPRNPSLGIAFAPPAPAPAQPAPVTFSTGTVSAQPRQSPSGPLLQSLPGLRGAPGHVSEAVSATDRLLDLLASGGGATGYLSSSEQRQVDDVLSELSSPDGGARSAAALRRTTSEALQQSKATSASARARLQFVESHREIRLAPCTPHVAPTLPSSPLPPCSRCPRRTGLRAGEAA